MDWLRLVNGLVSLLSNLLKWLNSKKLLDAGAKAAIADALLNEAVNVDKANKARLAQRLRDIGGVPDDVDPYRRD